MKIEIGEYGTFVLKEVYNGVVFETPEEELSLCMRDGGFEIIYDGEIYSIGNGEIRKLP